MGKQTCKYFLEKSVGGNFQLLSFIKRDTFSCDMKFNCNIGNEEGLSRFVSFYMKEIKETVKLKYKKNDE